MSFTQLDEQDLALRFPLRGSRLIEASAGTGKTFTISALYVRLVLGHGGETNGYGEALLPPQILVMTFTDAATQELRDRIRTRLAQAARYFRDEIKAPDELIEQLRGDYDEAQWADCASKLDIAAQWMDEAAVSTIHGWCQRMLREHAFDSGSLFTQTLETDHSELLAEVVRDYWRQYCYELDGAALSWVEHQWKTPDLLRHKLSGLLKHVQPAIPPESLKTLIGKNLSVRREQMTRLKAPWPAWAAELRELFDQACAKKLVNSKKFQARWYGPWLDKIAVWAVDEQQELLALDKGFERLTPAGMAEVCEPGQLITHPALEAMVELKLALDQLADPSVAMLEHAAQWVGWRFDAEKRRRAEMGFDDMLERLDEALSGLNGERLAEVIRKQFPVALIDEFQDTDPIQYRIFDRIYRVAENRPDCALLMIGDPKQAIYAFRGADIYTYLRARRATSGRHDSLDTNFRSSLGMVDAVNRVFNAAETRDSGQGAFLFRQADENPVPFQEVGARGRAERLLVEQSPAVPLTFWHAASPEPVSKEHYLDQFSAACASEIVRLLKQARSGLTGFEQDGVLHPLRPADIAILVRDTGEAQAIRMALAERGVRSVYLSDKDSVFDSEQARDLLLWLKACAQPDSDRALRAALASASLSLSLLELERLNQDERVWEHWVLRFRDYRQLWRRQGVLPMLRRFMNDFHLPATLMARSEGERVLTNLLHLSEILQQAASELDGEQALIRYLSDQIDFDGQTAEAQILRLESDEQLVKVVTIHKSKGLEYPLVFLPFICAFRPADKNKPPLRYHDEQEDLIVRTAPDDEDAVRADHERLAEDLRLLYVALTRARHACWLGVVDFKRGRGKESALHHSALGYLLGGGAVLPASSELGGWLESMCGQNPNLCVIPAPQSCNDTLPAADQHTRAPVYPVATQSIGKPWWIASYSALRIASSIVQTTEEATAMPMHGDSSPESPEAQKLFDDDVIDADGQAEVQAASAGGIHRFPRGPNPGTFLHGLFEWAGQEGFDLAAADQALLTDAVARRCNRRGWEAWIAPLSHWLTELLNASLPLGSKARTVRLAELSEYQVEMEFWFESRNVDVSELDRLVRRHTVSGAARPPAEAAELNGMFKGFIDLVFEHEGRYYVADYKSNWLGVDDAAYTEAAMQNAVLSKRYDLQYVLYLLALHRQLAVRLPDYDYDEHMGGALYLFLRGSSAATQGIYFERPPRELIEELDELFAGIGAEHPEQIA